MHESLRKDLDCVKSDAKKVTETKESLSKIVKANEKLSYEFEIIQCESMCDNFIIMTWILKMTLILKLLIGSVTQ